VITGLGLITPVGLTAGDFWDALRERRSGVGPIRSFDASELPTRFGGEVTGFDARDYLEKKDRKRLNQMPRPAQFAAAASRLAVQDARLDTGRIDPTRFGVNFGAGTIPGEPTDVGPAAQASTDTRTSVVDMKKWGAAGIARIPPTWMLSHVPNMLAGHVSILHNAQGPNNTITQTDAAGLLALGEACRAIGRNRADLFLVGAADDKINPITLVRQCLFSPLSRRNDDPARACRPFDRHRDGLVLGDGAGVLVVEEWEHARRRGATVYAEVVGFGAAFDGDGPARAVARAARVALTAAGVEPGQLDHVNAQGFSTPQGDVWEAEGLAGVLGGAATGVPVFAPSSCFGHLGVGAGTTELAASLLALSQGLLPATLNHEEPDPACPVRVAAAPRPVRRPYFLKVSLTPRGQCAAVVCRGPG
jgi:3-oxoacyl-[acyl-carrier-protein] synthase II